MAKETKDKEPKSLLELLEAKFGKGTVIQASSDKFTEVKEVVSTGSLTLDIATKIGGIPKGGLITLILGKESASKTTLSLHIIAEEQKKGNPCAFLDVEGTFDKAYARAIGVNLDTLYLIDTKMLLKAQKITDRGVVSGEEWLDVLIGLLQMNSFGVIVLDSIATLTPMAEITTGIAGGGQIARVGAMLSRAMRNINANLLGTNTGLVLLNQYRISPGKYGDPYVEVGGEALKYYTALKIELSKKLDKEGTDVYGIEVTAKITKSKVGIPYGRASYYVEFGKGIIRDMELFSIAVEADIIKKTGGWFQLPDMDNKIQGEDKVMEFLKDNPDYKATIEAKVVELINNGSVLSEEPQSEAA